MMIAPAAAALAEPSAHMSDRRFLSEQGTSPPSGPPVPPSPPVHPTSPGEKIIHEGRQQSYARMLHEAVQHGGAGITGVTNTHPPTYSASRPPIIADTTPTGYDSKPTP